MDARAGRMSDNNAATAFGSARSHLFQTLFETSKNGLENSNRQ
jgi:hypothetical protein